MADGWDYKKAEMTIVVVFANALLVMFDFVMLFQV